MKTKCPKCSAVSDVEDHFVGASADCPSCNSPFVITALAPAKLRLAKDEEKAQNKNIFQEIGDFFSSFCGLKPLTDLKFSHLFSGIFAHKTREDHENLWRAGHDVNSSPWPRPWAWARIGIGLLFIAILACWVLAKNPTNLNALPAVLFLGAFAVPLTCLILIYELDASRGVGLYEIAKGVLAGGAASVGLSLILYSITGLHETFLGATSAGIIEEIAKVAIAVALFGSLKAPKVSHGLVLGAAVGAGFAGFETAGYMLNALILEGGIQGRIDWLGGQRVLIEGFDYDGMLAVMLIRGILSPFCHVVWSAVAVGAAWHCANGRPTVSFSIFLQSFFLKPLLLVIGLHMLWNSGLLFSIPSNIPKNIATLRIWFLIWALSFYGSWCLMLLYCQHGIRETLTGLRSESERNEK